MGKLCRYCGVMIDSKAKICSNCGKVLTSENRMTSNQGGSQFSRLNQQSMPQQRSQRPQGHQYQPPKNQRPVQNPNFNAGVQPARDFSQHPNRKPASRPVTASYSNEQVDRQIRQQRPYETESHSGNSNKSKVKIWLVRGIKVAVVLAVIYFVFAFVRIFLVAHSTYDFGLDNVTLPSENYGDAMSAYFESGHWHCSLTEGVYYTGSHDGDDYEVYFGRSGGKEIVEKLIVNDVDKTTKDVMMTDVMGMFMAQSK